jgi:hypothetical protein
MNQGYIYLRSNLFFDLFEILKLGRTKNLYLRNKTYTTNELI